MICIWGKTCPPLVWSGWGSDGYGNAPCFLISVGARPPSASQVTPSANLAVGPMQIVFGGKAHPHDGGGKDLIRRIHKAAEALKGRVSVVYLENYEMAIAAKMVAGVDLWVNNPMKPLEASGTSGMKAALNGVPSLSVLDGWWIEGHIEGVTGWSIGTSSAEGDQSKDASDLFLKLERVILPLFYGLPFAYAEVMRSAIALNGSFFNTQRMVEQYVRNAYFPAASMVEETVA